MSPATLLALCAVLPAVASAHLDGRRGTVRGASLVADAPGVLRVGGPIQKTGKHAAVGLAAIAAMELWAEWANGAGLGYSVELKFEDDGSDAARAEEIVKRMLAELDVVVAPYTSTASLKVVKAVDSAKMVLVWGGSSGEIFQAGKRQVFGTFTQASSYMDSGLEALRAVGAKSVVLAANEKMFSKEVCRGAKAKAESLGMRVAREIHLKNDGSNAEEEAHAFAGYTVDFDLDVLVGCGHLTDVSALVSAVLRRADPNAILATQVATPEFTELISQHPGVEPDCLLMPTQWVPAGTAGVRDAMTEWDARDFVAKFRSKTGASPAYHSASAFAAVLALSHAVRDAGGIGDALRISNAMARLDIETFYGRIRFAPSGALTGKPMHTVQNQPHGPPKVVAPVGEVGIVYPLSQCGISAHPVLGVPKESSREGTRSAAGQRRVASAAALLAAATPWLLLSS